MQMHFDEISTMVAKGVHAVLLLDRAGWHTTGNFTVPKNVTLIFLPSKSPELNPVELIWQYLRSNWISNRVSETYADIVGAARDDWFKLTDELRVITSIGMRNGARVGRSREPLV